MDSNKYILLTIDVEDWFQVENFKPWIPYETWDQRELRVERNVHKLLDLFDSVELKGESRNLRNWEVEKLGESDKLRSQPNQLNEPYKLNHPNLSSLISADQRSGLNRDQPDQLNQPVNSSEAEYNPQLTTDHSQTINVHATFFVLGWIAERLPHLVREIQARGHEVASHGCNHELPNALSAKDLKNDLIGSKKLLEDITGQAVTGYRAPSFAINEDVLQTIGDCGYQYDSSYNSFSLHGRYGKISLNGTGKKGIAHKVLPNFYELPVSNLRFLGQTLPCGGGGYFRLVPLRVFKAGVSAILNKEGAYMFYMHPWEIDASQPMVHNASRNYKIRHYTNLSKTYNRLHNLIAHFEFSHFITCSHYIDICKST